MSREQRRLDRRQQSRQQKAAGGTPSRRTPVKVQTGSRLPVIPLAVVAGVLVVLGLLAYLIVQSTQEGEALSAAERAERDDSPDLPGTFVPSQGRGHFPGGFEGHVVTPFCQGVEQSEAARERSGTILSADPDIAGTRPQGTPTATWTPLGASGTPDPNATPSSTPEDGSGGHGAGTASEDCYASNPPSSGSHLGVQRNIDIGGGKLINLPPDPDVYPDDVEIPRDAIPHILEHAGVFVGWNCADSDTACMEAVERLKDLVNDRIDNHDDRVVMAKDTDLPEGTIGLSAWTRVLNLPASEFEERQDEVEDFIGTHSCRFDPENFCR
jgi:hypothetical protein